jgi:hypothetical protein
MFSMDSFYKVIFYLIAYILSLFSVNHIPSCLGSRVDMVSNLDPISMNFTLSSITTLPHQQRLGSSTINHPVRLCLSASNSAVFFSYNKSVSAKISQPKTIQRTG